MVARCVSSVTALGFERLVPRIRKGRDGAHGAWLGGSTTGMKALLTLACVFVLLASGCSAEQPSPPSDSHKEANNSQGSARDEARSDSRESTTRCQACA